MTGYGMTSRCRVSYPYLKTLVVVRTSHNIVVLFTISVYGKSTSGIGDDTCDVSRRLCQLSA